MYLLGNEEDDEQSPGCGRWREEPRRKQEEPERIRRRDEPGGTQATAIMLTHGGADGWRSPRWRWRADEPR